MRNALLNIVGLGGLGLLGTGMWWMSPAVSLTVIGGLMLGCSVYSILRRTE